MVYREVLGFNLPLPFKLSQKNWPQKKTKNSLVIKY